MNRDNEGLSGGNRRAWEFWQRLAAVCKEGGAYLINMAFGHFCCAKCRMQLTIREDRVEVFA